MIMNQMTNGETVENEEESLLKNENSGDDGPKINYRGWKVMPFIIGEQDFNGRIFCFYLLHSLLLIFLILV